MDWRRPTEALIPGLAGAVLRQLHAVRAPQTVANVHARAGTGSRNGVRYALEGLVDQGIVTRTSVGNTAVYELNDDHVAYRSLAAALDGYRPYEELRARLRNLAAERPWRGDACDLALYGSVVRREATVDSDVDLLLVVPDERGVDDPGVDELVDELHVAVRRWTGNRAHVDVRTRSEVQAAVRDGDPIAESWRREADFVFGGARAWSRSA